MNGVRGLLIAITASFIVGCSVGLVGGIVFMRVAGPPGLAGLRPGENARIRYSGPERRGMGRPDRVLPALERSLDLSSEQRERLVAQLDRARRHHAALRDSTRIWIERELTPEQRERWRRMEERFERSRPGRGPRGRPPDWP